MKLAFAIGLAALLATATSAAADSTFSLPLVQSSTSLVEFGPITSDGPGSVQVYNVQAGQTGALLGSTQLRAGSNTGVKVSLSSSPQSSALAVLVVNGEAVATQRLRFN